MSRSLPSVVLNALDDEVINPFFAVELLFDSPNEIRLWTGVGDLSYGGYTWTGSGTLMAISAVEEGSDLAVKGATLTFSGITADLLSAALAEPYQGRVCNIYLGINPDVPDLTSITELFSGYMDQMNITEGPEEASIELSVENKLIDLERPRIARYTSSYQKSVYPGDLGLDFIEDLQDKEIVWGKTVG
jgi:hypothetical protein